MPDEIPAERRFALQRGSCEAPGDRAMRLDRARFRRTAQCNEDALANLSGCFAREGHGHDRLGSLDARQTCKVALDQKLGLA